ncbi:MAG: thioesterase family protein [Actinobacteria bacterium]|nr:thioesterase family protein [Actinomycetota bacterium]
MSEVPEPTRVWSSVVPPEWSDYNGHMSEGWYGIAFGAASDELLVHLGFGAPYRDAHGTFYTAETRIRFLREVHEGAAISADTWLLGADEKRLHVLHHLLAGDDPEPAATQESMMLHVSQADGGAPRVGPMAEPLLAAALDLAAAHAPLPLADHVGMGIRSLR